MKKICFIVLFILSLMILASAGAARIRSGDWEYEPLEDGTAEITWYYGTETVVTVPGVIDGLTVTGMYQTFQDHEDVRIIYLPDTVERIRDYTFWNCRSLLYVTRNEEVPVSLGYMTFNNCPNLRGVALGPILSLGDHCFKDCSNLVTPLTLAVNEVPNQAFYYCSSLPAIYGLEGETVFIGPRAFYHCSNLAEMPIGTIAAIGQEAFRDCNELAESYRLGEEITVLPDYAFYCCKKLKEIRLPSTMTEIRKYSLYYCSGLTELKLPKHLKILGDSACGLQLKIEEVDIPDSVETLGKNVFLQDTVLIVGEGTAAYQYCVGNPYQQWRLRTEEDMDPDDIGADATTVEEMTRAVVEALIRDEMTDYEKALKLHDYIIYHANYDTGLTKRTAYELFFDRTGVCEAYSEAYHLLLDEAGIENCFEYNRSHRWNMACLDGIWTHIDCTFDDPIGGGAENHVFFGVTNYALEGVDSHECTVLAHTATNPDCSYLYRVGSLDQRIEELESAISDNLNAGSLSFTVSPNSFSGSPEPGLFNRLSLQAVGKHFVYRDHTMELETECAGDTGTAKVAVRFQIDEEKTFTLPEDTRIIEADAFRGAGAEKIIFGGNVSLIEDSAFDETEFLVFAGGNEYVQSFADSKKIWYESP